MVKQSTNVVNEEGIKKLGNLFLVGKVQSPLKRNPDVVLVTESGGSRLHQYVPDPLEMHRANLDDVAHFLTLQYAVTPSSCHAGHIEQFCAVYHVVVCSYT